MSSGVPAAPARDPAPLVISRVTVVPTDAGSPLADRSVLIEDGRIRAIGRAGEVEPAAAEVVDAAGKFLVPGLADMHAHFAGERDAALFLASGVTLVRNMAGSPMHLAFAERVRRAELPGPHLVTASPLVDGIGDEGESFWPGAQLLVHAGRAERLVRRYAGLGYRQIKVYSWLRPDVLRALGRSARSAGLTLTGHCPDQVTFEDAIAAGMSCFEHLTGIEEGHLTGPTPPPRRRQLTDRRANLAGIELATHRVDLEAVRRLAATMAAGRVWNCPTLVLCAAAGRDPAEGLADPRVRFVRRPTAAAWRASTAFDPDVADRWRLLQRRRLGLLRRVVSVLHEEGAPLLAGTDTPNPFVFPGSSLHEELAHLVAAGLSRSEALRCATSEAARFLGEEAEWGTIAAGRRADLLLTSGNPLEDLSALGRPDAVFVNGFRLLRTDLDAMLASGAS